MDLIPALVDAHAELITWRHDLHRHPELAFSEERTADQIAQRLGSWGIEVHRGLAGTGVIGVVRGHNDGGKSLGLRADIDALPMQELNDFEHRSVHEGAFHGCGHDGHTTMLLAAARHLAANRDFDGTVHLIFQPAEEGGGGARVMVEQGLFERFPCDQVYALHNWPDLPLGQAGVVSGPAMASADTFGIRVIGRGGHAAWPHTTVDPVMVGARIVDALQTLVSRCTPPQEPAVISVTQFHAGSAHNVIPDDATLRGTARAMSSDVRDALQAGISQVAQGVAAAHGAQVEVDYQRGYPVTINDPTCADRIAAVAAQLLGPEQVHRGLNPAMGGEDFAFMLERVPGAYLWLGQGGGPSACALHNARYDFNDDLLPIGASLWVNLVSELLSTP